MLESIIRPVRIAGLLMKAPRLLSPTQGRHVEDFLRFCPEGHRLRRLALQFQAMLRWRKPDKLLEWAKKASGSRFRFTARFAETLQRDREEVELARHVWSRTAACGAGNWVSRAGNSRSDRVGTSPSASRIFSVPIGRLLLDSYAFLWATGAPEELSPRIRALLESGDTQLYLSAATVWELLLKARKGLLDFGGDPAARIQEYGAALQTTALPVTAQHLYRAFALEGLHRDPFDRLLAAQGGDRRAGPGHPRPHT